MPELGFSLIGIFAHKGGIVDIILIWENAAQKNSYTRIFYVVLKKLYPYKVANWSFVAYNFLIVLASYDSELLSCNT